MSELLIVLFSFFLPTQFGYHFQNLATSIYGFKIDYFIPTLYLTDILIIGIITTQIRTLINLINKKSLFFISLYLLLIVVNIYISDYKMISFYKWIKLTEMLMMIITLINYKKLNIYKSIFTPLSYSVVLICFLGLLQTFSGGSIGGLFYYLGERSFDINTFGISTVNLNGVEILRSYSTFSHPNSLAGFLAVFSIVTLIYRKRLNRYYLLFLSLLVTTTLITSASLNVLVSFILLVVVYMIKAGKNLILSLILLITFLSPYLGATNFREIDYRIELSQVAVNLFFDKPLIGVGINNFIPKLAESSTIFKNVWELQPVHNIYLLVLSETGIVGFSILIILFYIIPLSYPLLTILFTGLFDHYWLTLQQNLFLFSLVIAISFAKIKAWTKS